MRDIEYKRLKASIKRDFSREQANDICKILDVVQQLDRQLRGVSIVIEGKEDERLPG